MSDKIVVYRLSGGPIELDRAQCHLFSRTELITGQACPQKRYFNYKWQGQGVEGARTPDDLSLGKAVHAGLEWMLREAKDYRINDGNDAEAFAEVAYQSAADKAKMEMEDDIKGGIDHGTNSIFDQLMPETAQVLGEEQANLAYALVWAFGKRRLASLLERYEVVEVEPEINWLVGSLPSGKYKTLSGDGTRDKGLQLQELDIYIVMMSRPDAILRSREDGKLWTVSWKTSKRFTPDYLARLECDIQSITEGLAVQAKYGEKPGGTFYSYFLKGDRIADEETGAKRYSSPLIRPYSNWTGVGEPTYKGAYKWYDQAGAEKRLGKGWSRTDIWKSMDMPSWLEILDSGAVQPEANRDWIGEVVAEPLPMPFKAGDAVEWLKVAVREEARWIDPEQPVVKHAGSCFNYNRPCTFFDICHRGDSLERQLAAGVKKIRVPHHGAEIQTEGED